MRLEAESRKACLESQEKVFETAYFVHKICHQMCMLITEVRAFSYLVGAISPRLKSQCIHKGGTKQEGPVKEF